MGINFTSNVIDSFALWQTMNEEYGTNFDLQCSNSVIDLGVSEGETRIYDLTNVDDESLEKLFDFYTDHSFKEAMQDFEVWSQNDKDAYQKHAKCEGAAPYIECLLLDLIKKEILQPAQYTIIF